MPLLLSGHWAIRHGHLTRKIARVLAIIAKTQKALLKALVALRGPVPLNATQLAYALATSPR